MAVRSSAPVFAVLWSALFASQGTPSAVTSRLQAELAHLAADQGFRERLRRLGIEAVGSTPEVLTSIMRQELDSFGWIVRSAGISVQN